MDRRAAVGSPPLYFCGLTPAVFRFFKIPSPEQAAYVVLPACPCEREQSMANAEWIDRCGSLGILLPSHFLGQKMKISPALSWLMG